jgi:hypothetical protein
VPKSRNYTFSHHHSSGAAISNIADDRASGAVLDDNHRSRAANGTPGEKTMERETIRTSGATTSQADERSTGQLASNLPGASIVQLGRQTNRRLLVATKLRPPVSDASTLNGGDGPPKTC